MNTDEVYEDITNAAALKKKMVDLLGEYNNSPGVVRMDLVLFRDAIHHGLYLSLSVSIARSLSLSLSLSLQVLLYSSICCMHIIALVHHGSDYYA